MLSINSKLFLSALIFFIFSNCNNFENVKIRNIKTKVIESDSFIVKKYIVTFPIKEIKDTFLSINNILEKDFFVEKKLCPIELSEQIALMLSMSNIDDVYYLGRINNNSLFFIQHEFGQLLVIISKQYNEICAADIIAMELGEDDSILIYSKLLKNVISKKEIKMKDNNDEKGTLFVQKITIINEIISDCNFRRVGEITKIINKKVLYKDLEKLEL